MIIYVDSSSLVKAYTTELETQTIRQLLAPPNFIVSALVAYPEVRAALARASRSGRFPAGEYVMAKRTFEADWQSLQRLDVDDPLVRLAGDLAEQHGLRGFDAIHLASALTLQRELGEPVFFSAFDDRLVDAAVASGLSRP